jgi:hypothetical protein
MVLVAVPSRFCNVNRLYCIRGARAHAHHRERGERRGSGHVLFSFHITAHKTPRYVWRTMRWLDAESRCPRRRKLDSRCPREVCRGTYSIHAPSVPARSERANGWKSEEVSPARAKLFPARLRRSPRLDCIPRDCWKNDAKDLSVRRGKI